MTMKTIHLTLLLAMMICHMAVVESQQCEEDGKFYPVGASWNVKCDMRCTCDSSSDGGVAKGCVSMCPPMPLGPGCRRFFPDRNPETSTGCCGEIVCDQV